MFSVDLIDDLFSEGGLEKVISQFIKEIVAGNALDLFFYALPYLIGFIIFYSIFRKVIAGIFKGLSGTSGTVVDSSSGLLGSFYDFMFNGAPKEEATDKAQRLLGDGKYREAAKFLRGYTKNNPHDEHAKALYEIATGTSSNNHKSSTARYGDVKIDNPVNVTSYDNNANYDSYEEYDSYNTPNQNRPPSPRKIAELGSDLVRAATGHKLTKEQMVHFAKTGKLPGQ